MEQGFEHIVGLYERRLFLENMHDFLVTKMADYMIDYLFDNLLEISPMIDNALNITSA